MLENCHKGVLAGISFGLSYSLFHLLYTLTATQMLFQFPRQLIPIAKCI